jgi:hypothetical protein
MPDLIDRLGDQVYERLRGLGFGSPKRALLDSLLRLAYQATLKTEEGRFVRGSLTFANPHEPDVDPPLTLRASFPSFTKLGARHVVTVDNLVKLSRAIDRWSGSIAVYAKGEKIIAWGVLDQLVHQSIRLYREANSGFSNPGLLTVNMDGVGDISAYHEDMFLGGIKAQNLIMRENDALASAMVKKYAFESLAPFAQRISETLGEQKREADVLGHLFYNWVTSIARLCIGLRRVGCGGAFLLTPHPLKQKLYVGHAFAYTRLRESMVLDVLDQRYQRKVDDECTTMRRKGELPYNLFIERFLAESDAEDRRDEMTGAVKLVTSLAAVDGLVLMTPDLVVAGFGAKIGLSPSKVYEGADFVRRGTRARTVDTAQFGTRHGSMLRYCALDRDALGLVVSQDGYVRLIMSSGKSLVFWDDLKLLGHADYSKGAVTRRRRQAARRRQMRKIGVFSKLGYTPTPKTLQALMKGPRRQARGTAIGQAGPFRSRRPSK